MGILDCGGKRSATPLWNLPAAVEVFTKSAVAVPVFAPLQRGEALCQRSPKPHPIFLRRPIWAKHPGEHTRPGCCWTRLASSLWAGSFLRDCCFPRGRGKQHARRVRSPSHPAIFKWVMRKMAPLESLGRHSISQPWARTICCTTASPRPVPFWLVVK